MDMKKILESMDAAAVGNKPFKGDPNFNDMKSILEGLEKVKNSEPEKEIINEDVSVTMAGHTAPEVAELVSLISNAGVKPMPAMDKPMPPMPKMAMPPMDKPPMDKMDMPPMADDTETEDWANAPDEEYAPYSDMTRGGDDLNKPKKSYPKAAGGDNPMALKDRIKEELENFYTKNYK